MILGWKNHCAEHNIARRRMSPFFAVILHHLLQLFHVLDDLLGPLTCSDVINSSKDQNFQPVGQVEIVFK